MYSILMIWTLRIYSTKKLDKMLFNIMTLNTIRIHYLIKLVIFWLLYFAFFRFLFLLFHHSKIPAGYLYESGLSFFHGLRLDLSTACILIFCPLILLTLQHTIKSKRVHQINNIFNYILITIVSFFSIANIKIYEEWGTLLNARALNYMLYPDEVLSFISFWPLLILLLSSIIFAFIGILFYRKFVTNFSPSSKSIKRVVIESAIFPVLILIGGRGGIQQAPINESFAHFSNIQINNLIATNNIWYLGHSLMDASDKQNLYVFSDLKNAKKIKEDLFIKGKDKTQYILKTSKPNIVFIVLESWTADIIKRLGGEEDVTPHFDALTKEGLLFTQMYGSGFRTEQGLVSIFSGFPAQPNNSIITTPSKAEKLPSLTTELQKKGYQLSFYYGGEIEFANMKSYLLNSGFEKIIDKDDFSKDQQNSKWGAHDEFVFEKQLKDLKNEKQPFCAVVLTLSSHEPFEVPISTPFIGTDEADRFRKAAYYSDLCLYNYIEQAKKESWYSNTIFILVADHGHRLPKNRNLNNPEARRIAAMIIGGALVDSLHGQTIEKICNQNDLPATILAQLQINQSDFVWSKNVFNEESKSFAYYSNENVLGWITPEETIIYSFATRSLNEQQNHIEKKVNDSSLIQAKAYLQTLYQQYLDY